MPPIWFAYRQMHPPVKSFRNLPLDVGENLSPDGPHLLSVGGRPAWRGPEHGAHTFSFPVTSCRAGQTLFRGPLSRKSPKRRA